MNVRTGLLHLVLMSGVVVLMATNEVQLYYASIPCQIFTAARQGDIEGIRMLRTMHPEGFRALTRFGQTSLHLAARYGHDELVYVLLTEIFNPWQVLDVQCEDGDTALHEAVDNNRKKIIVLLLQAGADICIKNDADLSPLEKAIEESPKDIVLLFLPYIDEAMRSNAQSSLLHKALMNRDSGVFQALKQAGFNIHAQNSNGQTLLHIVAEYNKYRLGKVFVAAGADINAQDAAGQTPLHRAAERGNNEFVAFLLSSGAQVTIRDHNGNLPLTCALRAQGSGGESDLEGERICFEATIKLLQGATLGGDFDERRNKQQE